MHYKLSETTKRGDECEKNRTNYFINYHIVLSKLKKIYAFHLCTKIYMKYASYSMKI